MLHALGTERFAQSFINKLLLQFEMKLYYFLWNFDKSVAGKINKALLTIDPLNKIFDGIPKREDFPETKENPQKVMFNAQSLVYKLDKKRLIGYKKGVGIVYTRNHFFHTDLSIMGAQNFWGLAFPDYKLCFVSPVINQQDMNNRRICLDYAIELAAHEIGATITSYPGEWEKCRDKRCFAYGGHQQRGVGTDIFPPRGRNHFCAKHRKLVLEGGIPLPDLCLDFCVFNKHKSIHHLF